MSSVPAEIISLARFDSAGLIPAIVQDQRTREVLTLAYMNREALERTIDSGETWFFSRSRQQLWHKGETSGNTQSVRAIRLDCDRDTVIVEVDPAGPACHTGAYSCFGSEPSLDAFLDRLYALILERRQTMPENSYTSYLFSSGLDKILKKVGEESAETIIAAKNPEPERLVSETADLLYHLTVLLVERGIPLGAIREELGRRHADKSGRG